MSWSFPGAWNGPPPANPGLRVAWGTSARNGSSNAILFTLNATLTKLANETLLGPGGNVRCTAPYAVTFASPDFYGASSARIGNPSNRSDIDEATTVTVGGGPTNASDNVTVRNGFSYSNIGNVSTCHSQAVSRSDQSSYLLVGVPFESASGVLTAQYQLPFAESFNYTFPANGGTWQIDDLAVGPEASGGGWAFSYSPCT
jgi:hypothetical protein